MAEMIYQISLVKPENRFHFELKSAVASPEIDHLVEYCA